jgi:hypothetical protein
VSRSVASGSSQFFGAYSREPIRGYNSRNIRHGSTGGSENTSSSPIALGWQGGWGDTRVMETCEWLRGKVAVSRIQISKFRSGIGVWDDTPTRVHVNYISMLAIKQVKDSFENGKSKTPSLAIHQTHSSSFEASSKTFYPQSTPTPFKSSVAMPSPRRYSLQGTRSK